MTNFTPLNGKTFKKGLILFLIFFACVAGWQVYENRVQKQLDIERQRIGQVMKQVGQASAIIQRNMQKQNKPALEDELAPHELTGEQELAQVMLWQSLPKDKQALLQEKTIQRGIDSASRSQ